MEIASQQKHASGIYDIGGGSMLYEGSMLCEIICNRIDTDEKAKITFSLSGAYQQQFN